ncbi:YcjX family protein [Rhodobacteraceae bacterium XHP0102]|nr:YcjX family protein [Rhodobacteraceae bacterium XHP0102]
MHHALGILSWAQSKDGGGPDVIPALGNMLRDSVEGSADALARAFSDPGLRIGVTGLSRAGKTVFITSLVANMIQRGRMAAFGPEREGRIEAAYLQPQPDDTVARFDYESHLAAMTGAEAHWPMGTRSVSQLRLSLRVTPKSRLARLTGPRRLHLDITDYPGEWLLDLGLLSQSYAQWSKASLKQVIAKSDILPEARDFLGLATEAVAEARHDEIQAAALARSFTAYLHAARAAGFSQLTPGRFILPGDLHGSPALTFAPLPVESPKRGSIAREAARRFEAYKLQIVRPFFRAHFAKIDRQVVLVDLLSAMQGGPEILEDLRQAMAGILSVFRHGANGPFSALLGQKTDRILFAATKADYLHQSQHSAYANLLEALVQEAKQRADYRGAKTRAMAIASLRSTVEERREIDGADVDLVVGRVGLDTQMRALFAGELPAHPDQILAPARAGARDWSDHEFATTDFAPPHNSLRAGFGPPHIRLDAAAEFLLADRMG